MRFAAGVRRTAALLALLVAGCGSPADLGIGGDFTLTDHHGRRFDTREQRGRALLVFFGFTYCPDVCPTTLARLTAVYRELGRDSSRVRTLFVTVDPARDTPAALREYLAPAGIDVVGLTGSPGEIAAVARQFAATFREEQVAGAAGYLMAHTTSMFGVDRRGRTRVVIPYDAGTAETVRAVRSLL